ncbi:hypothetical protein HBI22_059580 [Parastagonospora nodorum]|nr:hypothetical protein HBI32_023920 [Parastagonospora nodorum]KAH5473357.1 hypothetical protein HBI28_127990 [Parastagonospora nodorum]KAH5640805.1 hypothetical protein HBI22_059580 [Parastagonospora nodorum]
MAVCVRWQSCSTKRGLSIGGPGPRDRLDRAKQGKSRLTAIALAWQTSEAGATQGPGSSVAVTPCCPIMRPTAVRAR